MLTTNAVLDLALGKQHDNSSGLREKALAWLNEAICHLACERDWEFMKCAPSLTINSNVILKPADYLRFRYVKNEDTSNLFFFEERHRLTDEEVFENTDSNGTTPVGFSETSVNIKFHPGATGTVELGYVKKIPTYADNVTTIIDDKFKNLLARSVLSAVYEYEENNRAIPSISLDAVELQRLKTEENRMKAKPKRSKYLRGRL